MKLDINSLKIGDKITSDFFEDEQGVIRTIIELYDNVNTSSRRGVVFDGGEPCPHCKRPYGKAINVDYFPLNGFIDAAYVTSVIRLNEEFIMEDNIEFGVVNCARCGEDHYSLYFHHFKNPVKLDDHKFTLWAICPNTKEPIIMEIPVCIQM